MLKRVVLLSALIGQAFCWPASGQLICPATGHAKLDCLIPTALHTPPGEFSFLNTAFATQLSQLPLATPAAGILIEEVNGVPQISNKGFGPIMSERAETIGKHRLFLAFTYQYFAFHSIDGTDLTNVPIVLTLRTPTDVIYTATNNHIATTVNQYTGFATFGLTNRIDVSIAVPIERISLGMSSVGTEYSTSSSAKASFQEYVPGTASGFGDVVLAGKGTVLRREGYALAVGAEFRLPSGDAQNFLGSGAYGIKPYMAISGTGKISPHANLGYQWNSNSVLATNRFGNEQQLPTYFLYYFGADFNVSKRATLIADFLGQEFFNAPQVTAPMNVPIPNRDLSAPSIEPFNGSYASNNLALGVKWNAWKRLLLTGNVLIKLNDSGLRATAVPLIGASYTFR